MRIAVVCTDLGVRVPDAKGASLHVQSIVRAFAACGHQVALVAIGGHERYACPDGVTPLLLPHPGRAEGLERETRKLHTVEQTLNVAAPFLAAFAPDVVYERLSLFGTAGRRLAAMCGVPHVVEANALLAREDAQWRGLVLRELAAARERTVLRGADLRVAVSDELAEHVSSLAPNGPTITVLNGVELDLFDRPPPRDLARQALGLFGLPPEHRVVCFTGTLRPWHGLDIAIDAMGLLGAGVHLVVAGDGPVREQLEGRARAMGIADRVHWLGHVAHTIVPAVLAASDVAIAPYPSLIDFSFSPLKLFEYLAAGVPVVASDIGQIRTVLGHGRFGSLVPAGDPAALAGAISRTLADPAGARARSSAARAVARASFGWQHRAAEIIDAIEWIRSGAMAI